MKDCPHTQHTGTSRMSYTSFRFGFLPITQFFLFILFLFVCFSISLKLKLYIKLSLISLISFLYLCPNIIFIHTIRQLSVENLEWVTNCLVFLLNKIRYSCLIVVNTAFSCISLWFMRCSVLLESTNCFNWDDGYLLKVAAISMFCFGFQKIPLDSLMIGISIWA